MPDTDPTPTASGVASRPLDRLHSFLHRNRIRLAGTLWVTGDGLLVIEGGLSKDPVFAIGSGVITMAATANAFFNEAAIKYTPLAYIGTGIAYAVDGVLRHDPMKTALGTGMVVGTTAMYYGKKIAAYLAERAPTGRLLETLSGIRSEVVGELVYDAISLPILQGGYKLLQAGVAHRAPKDIADGALLLISALTFFAGNRFMGLAPPKHDADLSEAIGPRGDRPSLAGPRT